jgi:tetratricopeptide (TPR) repeat protein
MAEGLLGGLLGGEEEGGGDVELTSESLIGAEAFASAVASEQSRHHPDVARATIHFLREQAHILRLQSQFLADEHSVRLAYLRGQVRESTLRRAGQRMRVLINVFTAVVVVVLALGAAKMLYDAFTSRNVVVQSFQTPAALAPRGVTGQVVAADVLDVLQRLRDATRTVTKGLKTQSAWSSDVKIEVPETGISIGEVDRLLHERFGHDVHIEGELVQSIDGGLALTVRGEGVPPQTFSGGAGDLDNLATKAGEYIYGRSQPYQFAAYLAGGGRYKDALEFLPGAFARADTDVLRADLANVWGSAYTSLGQPKLAAEKFRLVMALSPPHSPKWWNGWGNLLSVVALAQGEEIAWRESRAYLQAVDHTDKSQRPDLAQLTNPASITWDLPLQLSAELADSVHNGGAGATSTLDGPEIADVYGLMHDPVKAARYLSASDPNDSGAKAEALMLAAYDALDRGQPAAAVAPLEAFWKAWKADTSLHLSYPDAPCLLGLVYGRVGRAAEAEALFKSMGPLSRCAAAHGDVLARSGDIAGAQQVWAEGLRLAPSLPLIYLTRGQWELEHGDLASAETDLARASAQAPHFADPLKAWGDVLMRENRHAQALAKYNEALKYAPAWDALRRARDAAVARSAAPKPTRPSP